MERYLNRMHVDDLGSSTCARALARMKVPDEFKQYHSLSNFDIIQFCKMNNVPLKGIYMRGDLQSTRARVDDPRSLNRMRGDDMSYRTGAFVFNLNGQDRNPGTHWTCAYNGIQKNIYFDPFGMMPSDEVKRFLKIKKKPVDTNINPLQNINTVSCGYFVCLVLYVLSHRQSFYSIIHELFSFDVYKNEAKLKDIFKY